MKQNQLPTIVRTVEATRVRATALVHLLACLEACLEAVGGGGGPIARRAQEYPAIPGIARK